MNSNFLSITDLTPWTCIYYTEATHNCFIQLLNKLYISSHESGVCLLPSLYTLRAYYLLTMHIVSATCIMHAIDDLAELFLAFISVLNDMISNT